ncbi:MAG: trehalose-phosphatase [Anaerolineae bacterium]|jgi:trehalose 6-phosphate phosphatase|nr:trehalose-phosphatase [Anaerolineae bacterium]
MWDLKRLFQFSRIGLISDFDGTLSPIVSDPAAAQLTPRNRELLQALQPRLTLLALISGRGVLDLAAKVAIPGAVYIGNHGFDRLIDDQIVHPPDLDVYRAPLQQILTAIAALGLDGVQIEDKGATASIHYRRSPDPAMAHAILGAALQPLIETSPIELFTGRMIYELRPPLPVNKGTAFADLVTAYQLDAVVFLGDDVTDADAMRVAQHMRQTGRCYTLTVGVQTAHTPQIVLDHSDVLVSEVTGIEAWLASFLSASSN